jgi:hypothetical protein
LPKVLFLDPSSAFFSRSLVPKRKPWERKFPAKLCFATLSPLHLVTEVFSAELSLQQVLKLRQGSLPFW